jgi:hypothetical protein
MSNHTSTNPTKTCPFCATGLEYEVAGKKLYFADHDKGTPLAISTFCFAAILERVHVLETVIKTLEETIENIRRNS